MEQERNTIVSIYCRGGEERQLAYSSFFFIVHYSSDLMAWYDESDVWKRGISSNTAWGITSQINCFSFFTASFRYHGCLFIHILYMFCHKKCTHIWNQTHKVYVHVVRYRRASAGSVHYFQNILIQGFTVLLSSTNTPHEYAVLLLKAFETTRR